MVLGVGLVVVLGFLYMGLDFRLLGVGCFVGWVLGGRLVWWVSLW